MFEFAMEIKYLRFGFAGSLRGLEYFASAIADKFFPRARETPFWIYPTK